MRRGWLFLLILMLAALLASCTSAPSVVAPTPTTVPTATPVPVSRLAAYYTGKVVYSTQKTEVWSVSVVDEDLTTGTFRGTIIFNNNGSPYPYRGTIDYQENVTFSGIDDPALQLAGMLHPGGIINGTGTFYTGDTGSTWTLSPAPA